MTLFDVVFSGNDAVYGLTEKAIDDAIAANGADKAVAFPDTACLLYTSNKTGGRACASGKDVDGAGAVQGCLG